MINSTILKAFLTVIYRLESHSASLHCFFMSWYEDIMFRMLQSGDQLRSSEITDFESAYKIKVL